MLDLKNDSFSWFKFYALKTFTVYAVHGPNFSLLEHHISYLIALPKNLKILLFF